MAACPRKTDGGRALRLACRNADGVRSRKLELENFLNQHSVDIHVCLLSEKFLHLGQAFRLANYVSHRKDSPTVGGVTAILVHRGIVHYLVSSLGLTYHEATTKQIMLDPSLVKVLAAYLSSSRPRIGEDLDACFGGGLPVLLAGDVNAKHVDWNLRLSSRSGKHLRDYDDENLRLIFRPNSPTIITFKRSATPDVLNILINRYLPFLVHLTSCSALTSDHLPLRISTMCRSSL
jgi:hypothetical protein